MFIIYLFNTFIESVCQIKFACTKCHFVFMERFGYQLQLEVLTVLTQLSFKQVALLTI